jgi:hypothetical protein
MGWLGGLTRAASKGYIGHKTGQLQGREAKRKRDEEREEHRQSGLKLDAELAERERQEIIDELNIAAKRREAARTPADELSEFEAKEKIRAKYPSAPPRANPPSYSERRDRDMIRYRDQLIKSGVDPETANKRAREKYMRERPSTDDLAALLGAWGGGGRDTTSRRP